MRITNSMMVNKFLTESNSALSRVSKYQSQVDSTKRISNIADDPQATMIALKARNKLSNLDLYKGNIQTAKSYLKEAESVTSELNEVIKSAYDDVMSAQSGAKGPEEWSALSEDLKNLQKEILSLSNTTIGTNYLFGGYNYTGKIDNGEKTPPFTVVGKDLIYNGINLSQFSWSGDYDTQTAQMASAVTTISNIAGANPTTYKDFYSMSGTGTLPSAKDTHNKDLAQSALDTVNNLIASGKAALDAAESFGFDSSNTTALNHINDLKNYLYGFDTAGVHTNGLADYAATLSNEASKELTGSYIVVDADSDGNIDSNIRTITSGSTTTVDYDYYQSKGMTVYADNTALAQGTVNDFKSDAAGKALSDTYNFLTNAYATPATYPSNLPAPTAVPTATLSTVTTNLQGDFSAVLNPAAPAASPQAALNDEKDNITQLRIGASSDQIIEITKTGLDLLGTGSDNVYHIIGKVINLLDSVKGVPADKLPEVEAQIQKQLSPLISSVQKAQTNVLTLETRIGAEQNRLTLTSSRYDSSGMNYTEMRSNAEDADMAEAIMNLTTAQTVYNAALAGGAEILKTSLIDFLR